jgi:hypothetical protein
MVPVPPGSGITVVAVYESTARADPAPIARVAAAARAVNKERGWCMGSSPRIQRVRTADLERGEARP